MARRRVPRRDLCLGLAILSLLVLDAVALIAHDPTGRSGGAGPPQPDSGGSAAATLSGPGSTSPSVGAPAGPASSAALGSRSSTTASTSRPLPTTTSPGSLKPVARGLVDRKGTPDPGLASIVTTSVVRVNWAEIQPAASSSIVENNAIDRALSLVRSGALGDHLLKLRIYAGVGAPAWTKSLGGQPLRLADANDDSGATGTVGRFWTPEFGRAYAELQSKLATKYDAVPEIVEVQITRCATFFAETLLREASSAANRLAYRDAGYTVDADERCIREQIEAHRVWVRTRSGMSLNPYQRMQPGFGDLDLDLAYTVKVMDDCGAILGHRCVLENNSVRWPIQEGFYGRMYVEMGKRSLPLTFQTARPDRVGDWYQVVGWAAQLGASAVELPEGYEGYDRAKLAQASALLRANAEREP